MKRNRNNSIILLLALLVSLFAPEEVECARVLLAHGTTPTLQVNCVHALCPTEELEWDALSRSASSTPVCSPDTHDDLTEVYYPACLTRPAGRSSFVLHPGLLMQAPDLEALLLGKVIARPLEFRGPPLSKLALCPPSLRAPPIA